MIDQTMELAKHYVQASARLIDIEVAWGVLKDCLERGLSAEDALALMKSLEAGFWTPPTR